MLEFLKCYIIVILSNNLKPTVLTINSSKLYNFNEIEPISDQKKLLMNIFDKNLCLRNNFNLFIRKYRNISYHIIC